MEKVKITSEYITLGQFLKYVNIISSGSDAKMYINENEIYINNEKEDRRGRKIYDGFIIKINKKEYQVKKE